VKGKLALEWVTSTLHTTSEHGVSSITTADAHNSAASSRLNRRPPGRFKWTRPFRLKTKSGFCACAITFQLACITEQAYRKDNVEALGQLPLYSSECLGGDTHGQHWHVRFCKTEGGGGGC